MLANLCSLYFVYLFIAKFALVYIHSVSWHGNFKLVCTKIARY